MKPGQLIKKIVRKEPGTPLQLAIPLTMPVAASLVVILLCVLGWAFFMGWMVGSGQNPQARLSGLTGLAVKEKEPQSTQEKPEMAAEAPAQGGESGQLGGEARFQRPSGEQLSAWPDPPARDAVAPSAQAKRQPAPPKRQAEQRQSGQRFNFTYQVAAFRTSQEASVLAARLKKDGIRCSTSKNGKVFLVTASLRGTDADARALVEKLRGMKLGQPLRLARTPLAGGGKK